MEELNKYVKQWKYTKKNIKEKKKKKKHRYPTTNSLIKNQLGERLSNKSWMNLTQFYPTTLNHLTRSWKRNWSKRYKWVNVRNSWTSWQKYKPIFHFVKLSNICHFMQIHEWALIGKVKLKYEENITLEKECSAIISTKSSIRTYWSR